MSVEPHTEHIAVIVLTSILDKEWSDFRLGRALDIGFSNHTFIFGAAEVVNEGVESRL
jgi:hypothetical protein